MIRSVRPFIISHKNNSWIDHLKKLRSSRSYREEHQSTVITNLLTMAEFKGQVLVRGASEDYAKKFNPDVDYIMNSLHLERATGDPSPQGMVWEVAIPNLSMPTKIERLLVLDKLKCPGNAGTLIRTAFAFNFDAVFVTENTVDPFSPKTISAAKGANFKVPVIEGPTSLLLEIIQQHGLCPVVSSVTATDVEAKVGRKFALILGSEPNGISVPINGVRMHVPINPEADSLNVAIAGAILMHRLSIK